MDEQTTAIVTGAFTAIISLTGVFLSHIRSEHKQDKRHKTNVENLVELKDEISKGYVSKDAFEDYRDNLDTFTKDRTKVTEEWLSELKNRTHKLANDFNRLSSQVDLSTYRLTEIEKNVAEIEHLLRTLKNERSN